MTSDFQPLSKKRVAHCSSPRELMLPTAVTQRHKHHDYLCSAGNEAGHGQERSSAGARPKHLRLASSLQLGNVNQDSRMQAKQC